MQPNKKTEATSKPANTTLAGAGAAGVPVVDAKALLSGRKQAADLRDANEAYEEYPVLSIGLRPECDIKPGDTFAGEYVETVHVYRKESNGLGVRDAKGRFYSPKIVLRNPETKAKFGIWGVGQLTWHAERLRPGQYLEATYNGKAEKALKPGQQPPHDFTLRIEGELLSGPVFSNVGLREEASH